MENETSIDAMWDEAFADVSEDDGGDGGEVTPATEETEIEEHTDGDENGTDENDTEEEENGTEGQNDGGAPAANNSAPVLTEQDLAEINEELGTNYRTPSEFPYSRRYIELRENGKFTAREALAAVGATAGANKGGVATGASKGHLTSSRSRGSNGEVMTSADRDELAKWGFKTQGKELESLWRRARG